MMKLRYDRILWIAGLLIVGVILVSAIRDRKRSFAHDTIVDIEPLDGGNKLITENNVRQLLLRTFGNTLEGTEMSLLDVQRIEKTLESDPFVLDADAYVDQKNVLHVHIEQRAPMLRILDNQGGNYYIDENGIKMPVSANFAAHVIVATGNVAPYSPDFLQRKRTSLKDLYQITKTLLADEFLAGFIQQIHVANNNEFVLTPLIGDQKILLGSARNLDDKLNRLKIFYKEGMPYEGWRKYETVNLKYSGQVVCKR